MFSSLVSFSNTLKAVLAISTSTGPPSLPPQNHRASRVPSSGKEEVPGLLWVQAWSPLPSEYPLNPMTPRNAFHSPLIQEPQMENFSTPNTIPRNAGPAAGSRPDPQTLPTTQVSADPSAPNASLQAPEEPPGEAGSLCPPSPAPVPSSLQSKSQMLTPRAHTTCSQGKPQVSSAAISAPVFQLWPCQYQQFESLH